MTPASGLVSPQPRLRVADAPLLRVAYLRHIGPYHEIGPTFDLLFEHARDQALFRPDTRVLAFFYDNPRLTPPRLCRADCALSLPPQVQPLPPLEVMQTPGGKHAVYEHVGSYEQLSVIWRQLTDQWVPDAGHTCRAGDPPFELYLNSCDDTPPAELRTELWAPIE